jgi:hypothetical protein
MQETTETTCKLSERNSSEDIDPSPPISLSTTDSVTIKHSPDSTALQETIRLGSNLSSMPLVECDLQGVDSLQSISNNADPSQRSWEDGSSSSSGSQVAEAIIAAVDRASHAANIKINQDFLTELRKSLSDRGYSFQRCSPSPSAYAILGGRGFTNKSKVELMTCQKCFSFKGRPCNLR